MNEPRFPAPTLRRSSPARAGECSFVAARALGRGVLLQAAGGPEQESRRARTDPPGAAPAHRAVVASSAAGVMRVARWLGSRTGEQERYAVAWQRVSVAK